MNNNEAAHPENCGPVRKTMVFDGLTYEKIDSYSLDAIIFNSRNVCVFPFDDCINYLFLKEDDKTFISVLCYSAKNIWVAEYENTKNPYAKMKRNDDGMMQSGD